MTNTSSDVTDSPPDALHGVARLLGRSLRSLGEAGRSDEACRLAADAWVLLREVAPVEAARFAGLLHGLTGNGSTPAGDRDSGDDRADRDLDVRDDPPATRHQRIFETYAQLSPGTAFVLVNDHDPKPLYYQFEAEHHGEFEWDALESGPVVWRVRIGRPAATSRSVVAALDVAKEPLDMADTSLVQQSSAEATAEREDRWLDRWLIDSFPASDPLPGPSAIGGPACTDDCPEHTDATKQGGP